MTRQRLAEAAQSLAGKLKNPRLFLFRENIVVKIVLEQPNHLFPAATFFMY